MKLVNLIIIIVVLAVIYTDGKILPVMAEGFSTVPAVVQTWQKETSPQTQQIKAQIIEPIRARMVAFALPKIKKVINIDKIAEDLHRLRVKVQRNV